MPPSLNKNPWTTGPKAPWHWTYYRPKWNSREKYMPFVEGGEVRWKRNAPDIATWDLLSPERNPHDTRERRALLPKECEEPLLSSTGAQSNGRAAALAGHESPWNDIYGPSSPLNTETDPAKLGTWLRWDATCKKKYPGLTSPRREQFFLEKIFERIDQDDIKKTFDPDGAGPAYRPELRWIFRNDLFFANKRVPCQEGLRRKGDRPSCFGFQMPGDRSLDEWDGYSGDAWVEHCPHFLANKSHPGAYEHAIKPCVWGSRCGNYLQDELKAVGRRSFRHPHEQPRLLRMVTVKGNGVLAGFGNKPGYYVCRHHLEASRRYFQSEKILEAMRFGTCEQCRVSLLAKYPHGVNNCSCEKTLDQWLCRMDYRDALTHLIERFVWRICRKGPWGGLAGSRATSTDQDESYTFPADEPFQGYQRCGPAMEDRFYEFLTAGGTRFRDRVYRLHPCGLGCGRVRKAQAEVMDCRSCGGLIVRPEGSSNIDTPRTPITEFPPPPERAQKSILRLDEILAKRRGCSSEADTSELLPRVLASVEPEGPWPAVNWFFPWRVNFKTKEGQKRITLSWSESGEQVKQPKAMLDGDEDRINYWTSRNRSINSSVMIKEEDLETDLRALHGYGEADDDSNHHLERPASEPPRIQIPPQRLTTGWDPIESSLLQAYSVDYNQIQEPTATRQRVAHLWECISECYFKGVHGDKAAFLEPLASPRDVRFMTAEITMLAGSQDNSLSRKRRHSAIEILVNDIDLRKVRRKV